MNLPKYSANNRKRSMKRSGLRTSYFQGIFNQLRRFGGLFMPVIVPDNQNVILLALNDMTIQIHPQFALTFHSPQKAS